MHIIFTSVCSLWILNSYPTNYPSYVPMVVLLVAEALVINSVFTISIISPIHSCSNIKLLFTLFPIHYYPRSINTSNIDPTATFVGKILLPSSISHHQPTYYNIRSFTVTSLLSLVQLDFNATDQWCDYSFIIHLTNIDPIDISLLHNPPIVVLQSHHHHHHHQSPCHCRYPLSNITLPLLYLGLGIPFQSILTMSIYLNRHWAVFW